MNIGAVIIFLALITSALALELSNRNASGLWVLVVVFALFADFDR